MKRLVAIIGALSLLVCVNAYGATKKPAKKTAKPVNPATAAKVKNFKYGTRAMRTGMSGKDVKTLQGYLSVVSLAAAQDGMFGKSTRRSVKAYEATHQKPRDGIVQRGQAKKIKALAVRLRAPGSGQFLFPVVGPHNFGGAGAVFGAPRGDHIHQGQDVIAACNTPLRAASGGFVRVNSFQAGGAGNYVVIRSNITFEDYAYMHLAAPSVAAKGTTVPVGAPIGNVGNTGDSQGCHLHFEMWTAPGWFTGGAPYDPLPSLKLWDAYS